MEWPHRAEHGHRRGWDTTLDRVPVALVAIPSVVTAATG